jgi:hypothetical protein
MHEDQDPVAGALQALKDQQWAGGRHNHDLEEKLMQRFDTNTRASRGGGRRVLILAAGALLLGGVGFAAAGGVDMVRSWFVTIEVQEGAIEFTKPVDFDEVTISGETDGQTINLILTDPEGREIPEDSYTVDDTQVIVTIEPAPEDAAAGDAPASEPED